MVKIQIKYERVPCEECMAPFRILWEKKGRSKQ